MNGLILIIRLWFHQRAWTRLLFPSLTWAKLQGFITHQRLDGNLAWQSGSNCCGCCTRVALEKNNFRITCSLLVISAAICLLGLELPFIGKFEKCLSSLEWQWLTCRLDLEKGALCAKKSSFIDPNWPFHKISRNWISYYKKKVQTLMSIRLGNWTRCYLLSGTQIPIFNDHVSYITIIESSWQPRRSLLSAPFPRWEKWSPEILSNMLKSSRQGGGIQVQIRGGGR